MECHTIIIYKSGTILDPHSTINEARNAKFKKKGRKLSNTTDVAQAPPYILDGGVLHKSEIWTQSDLAIYENKGQSDIVIMVKSMY